MSVRPDAAPVRSRLQRLVDANLAIATERSLEVVLPRVVALARELGGAADAVLHLDPTEHHTRQIVHTGADPVLLDLLRQRSHPAELGPLDLHGTRTLAVPIATAAVRHGTLYLLDMPAPAAGVGEEEDEAQIFTAFAGAVASAVENARLFVVAERQRRRLAAVGSISRHLLANGDVQAVLSEVAEVLLAVADASTVVVLVPVAQHSEQLEVKLVAGRSAEGLDGLRITAAGSLAGQAMRAGHALVVEDLTPFRDSYRHFTGVEHLSALMACPLQGSGPPLGAMVVLRSQGKPFSAADLETAQTFTSQAATCLELAEARSAGQKLALMEDRARIARDLHDHVVQRLFAAGLTLQGTAGMSADRRVQRRLEQTVQQLDETIRSIRSSIFQLQEPLVPLQQGVSLRTRVVDLLGELAPVLGFTPQLSLEGPLDTVADPPLVEELEAVLRETLTNVAKHSRASLVEVGVRAHEALLVVEVGDDGVGLGASARRSGLANLRTRAEQRGGFCELGTAPGGGLLVTWTVPVGAGTA